MTRRRIWIRKEPLGILFGRAWRVYRTKKQGFLFGVLAALLWAPHFYVVESLRPAKGVAGMPVLVAEFYFLLCGSVILLALLFVSGRLSELAVFKRRETHFLILAASGGYAFWLLRDAALAAISPAHAHLLFYSAPLLMGALSLLTAERADRRAVLGLLFGFVGGILILHRSGGAAASLQGSLLAVGAAACWALFSVMARPIVREEKALPVAVLVMAIGAACLLVTCLSRGENILAVKVPQLWTALLAGALTVGLMMVFWLKCVGMVPVALASPLWYLALVFGIAWARWRGLSIAGWWALAGSVAILLGLHIALSGRRRTTVTIADIIRG
ncbi:hypothetical protein ES703_70994 [subsurface metagenome]